MKKKSVLNRITGLGLSLALGISGVLSTPGVAQAKAYNPEEDYKAQNLRFYNDQEEDFRVPIRFYINAAERYELEQVTNPTVGSTYGEWTVMDLLRGMYMGTDYINYINDNYFTDYLSRLESYIDKKNGILDRSKITEWNRTNLTLTALGQDITKVGTGNYDYLQKYSSSFKATYKQGINGTIWTLIGLDTGNYSLYDEETIPKTGSYQNADADDINTRRKMVDRLFEYEITTKEGVVGGWALSGDVPDPDITGMALQALAPYYVSEEKFNALNEGLDERDSNYLTYQDLRTVVQRGIKAMADMQTTSGGFNAWGNSNLESTTQVVVALCALQIDPLSKKIPLDCLGCDVDFNAKGGAHDDVYVDNIIDAMLLFYAEGSGSAPNVGGFKHVTSGYDGGGGAGTGVNAMATDQGLYGLIAYDRFLHGENSLYDMTDMMNGEYKNMKAKTYTVKFVNGDTSFTRSYSPYAIVDMSIEDTSIKSWNTRSDGLGSSYFANNEEYFIMPEEDITLYASTNSALKNPSVKTNLESVSTTYSDVLALTVSAKDCFGDVIFAEPVEDYDGYITVWINGEQVEAIKDTEAGAEYSLPLKYGDNTVSISVNDVNHRKKTIKNYTVKREYNGTGKVSGKATFSIEAFTINEGYIEKPVEISVVDGMNVAEFVTKALEKLGHGYKNGGTVEEGFYLTSIDNVYFDKAPTLSNTLKSALDADTLANINMSEYNNGELKVEDFYSMSGFKISYNDEFPDLDVVNRYVQPGDVIRVQFTVTFGTDVGASDKDNLYNVADKTALTRVVSSMNSNAKVMEYVGNDNSYKTNYDNAILSLCDIGASQTEVDAMLGKLVSDYDEINKAIAENPELDTAKDGDFNGDSVVNSSDLLYTRQQFNKAVEKDANGDKIMNSVDLLKVIQNYLKSLVNS